MCSWIAEFNLPMLSAERRSAHLAIRTCRIVMVLSSLTIADSRAISTRENGGTLSMISI